MEEIMLKTNLKIGVRPDSAQMDSLRYSSDPLLKRAYDERIKPNLPLYEKFFDGERAYKQMDLITEKDFALFDMSMTLR